MARPQDLQDPEVMQSVLRIYENFYWMHEWIIDVCARWILKSDDIERKLSLVEQAWEERGQMRIFKQEILDLGFDWDKLDHPSYMFQTMRARYNVFQTTEDELEVLIGMNLFSEGVFGYTELEQLHKQSPELFPKFLEFAEEEARHAEQGMVALQKHLEREPQLHAHARMLVEKYHKALVETAADEAFGPFLRQLVDQDIAPRDVVERALARYEEVFKWLAD